MAQHKIAIACHDRSWFVSPRNSATLERPWLVRSVSDDGGETSRRSSNVGSPLKPDLYTSGLPLSSTTHHQLATEMLDWTYVNAILSQLVEQATCPHSGGILELQILGEDFFTYHIQRGKASHLDDYCFQILFQCLSLKNIVYLLNCILLEQRVLIHSNVSVVYLSFSHVGVPGGMLQFLTILMSLSYSIKGCSRQCVKRSRRYSSLSSGSTCTSRSCR